MTSDRDLPEPTKQPARPRSGLGVACFEAQADGVPCSDVGARCGDCDRVRVRRQGRDRPPAANQPASDDA